MVDVSMFGNKLKDNVAYQMFGCVPVEELSTSEIDEAIEECNAMLYHFIQQKNAEEIAYWRGALQNAKITKRSIVNT